MTRVRFAPSPTGALHIGGVRTALYNYLFVQKMGGTFILRIEDTDRSRFTEGAEKYIIESLNWLGIEPSEGVTYGGPHQPYRQSDRKALYTQAAKDLLAAGKAYIAFDTPEELDAKRASEDNFTYNHTTRSTMINSLTLDKSEVEKMLADGVDYVIRLKVEADEIIRFTDRVRGDVRFNSNELDDKVLLKADGMPTYHLANVVDDHAMEITNVIRGEEWLPSTAHHVLLYRAFGWENKMPEFAHLPLILKPVGNGKLSKRDGAKFDMPVFPLSWNDPNPENSFIGFRETGFLPNAVLNFLAMMGWSDSSEQEIFSLGELVEKFDIDRIQKAGARFNYDKAKWFNQQYIAKMSAAELVPFVAPWAASAGYSTDTHYLEKRIELMKERAVLLPDFINEAPFLYVPVTEYDQKTIDKRWNEERGGKFKALVAYLTETDFGDDPQALEALVKSFLAANEIGVGDVFPFLRLSLAGVTQGPGIFEMMLCFGKAESLKRFAAFLSHVA